MISHFLFKKAKQSSSFEPPTTQNTTHHKYSINSDEGENI